jgi:hypothetical protein
VRVVVLVYLSAITFLTGCGEAEPRTPEGRILKSVQEKNQGTEWFAHVTDWEARAILSDFAIQTDFAFEDVHAYPHTIAICEAIRAEISPDSDEHVLIRVNGYAHEERTDIEGVVERSEESEMMAQASDAVENPCGATPEYSLKEQLTAMDVPLFSNR